jgi:hypothetical protein
MQSQVSVGYVLIVVGLGLDVLATLFLSVDLLLSQNQFAKYVDIHLFIEDLDEKIADLRRSISENPVSGDSPEIKALIAGEQAVLTGSLDADIKNRKQSRDQLNEWSDHFHHRVPLVKAAIAAVVAGGLLNLIGVIFFHG